MSEREKQEIIYLFFTNKNKLKKLYDLFAEKFPEHGKLWKILAATKDRQEKTLRNFSHYFSGNFFRVSFHARLIITYIGDFIDRQIHRAKNDKLDTKEALAAALSLERSLTENQPFEIVLPLNAELEKFFLNIKRESERQIIILNKAFGKAG